MLFFFKWPSCVTCGILSSPTRDQTPTLQWKYRALTTGPPGKSLLCLLTTLFPCPSVCPLYSGHGVLLTESLPERCHTTSSVNSIPTPCWPVRPVSCVCCHFTHPTGLTSFLSIPQMYQVHSCFGMSACTVFSSQNILPSATLPASSFHLQVSAHVPLPSKGFL